MRLAWELDGPDQRRDPAGLAAALRALYEGRRGPPLDSDRPPLSVLPLTRAARAALHYSRCG